MKKSTHRDESSTKPVFKNNNLAVPKHQLPSTKTCVLADGGACVPLSAMALVDCHCHLTSEKFDHDFEARGKFANSQLSF